VYSKIHIIIRSQKNLIKYFLTTKKKKTGHICHAAMFGFLFCGMLPPYSILLLYKFRGNHYTIIIKSIGGKNMKYAEKDKPVKTIPKGVWESSRPAKDKVKQEDRADDTLQGNKNNSNTNHNENKA